MESQRSRTYPKLNPKKYPEVIAYVNENDHFYNVNGLSLDSLSENGARGSMTVTPRLTNPLGTIHGGALATLADTVAASAATTLGAEIVTLSSTMNYLRAVSLGKIFCEARIIKSGKTVVVCDVEISDSDNRLIATGTFTFYKTKELDDSFRV